MDLEIEKFVKKQIQLQEQIEKLITEKKMLQDQICVLNECLSLEKVNRKISDLENKQKILTTLESMVNNLRTDIKPLEYLKQALQRQLMVSTLSTNDLNTEKHEYSESSLLTSNSMCAIETLDSLSDVSSEESVMVLSDYDVVSDEEVFNNAEKPVGNKVMYEEALQMASSVHLTLVEHSIPNVDTIEPLINNSDELKDNNNYCVQSDSKNNISLMNLSNTSEQLLDLYDIINKQDLLNSNENENTGIKCDKRKTELTLNKSHQPCICYKEFGDNVINTLCNKECDNVSTLANNSWVKVNTNESFDISNEQFIDIFQPTTDSQKDNTVSKVNIDVDFCGQDIIEIESFNESCNNIDPNNENEIKKPRCSFNDSNLKITKDSITLKQFDEPKNNLNLEIQVHNDYVLYNHQFESKDLSEIKSFENSCNDNNHSNKSEIQNPVFSNNIQQYGVKIISPLSSSAEDSNVSNKFIEQRVNTELESQVYNDQLNNHQFESKDISEIKSFENGCNDNNHSCEIHNPVFPNYVQQYEVKIISPLSSSTKDSDKPNKFIEQKVNAEIESQVYNDPLNNHQFKSKDISEIKSFENGCNDNNHYYKNEIYNPVSPNDEVEIISSLLDTESSDMPRELNNSSNNINDKLSSINNNEKSMLLCRTIDLKDELLNGIHQHGIQDLMSLQRQCMSHFINGRDIIFHSYPCVGKSTVCLISVLQRINTRLNECQAIVLVPTLELALSAQKTIKSIGKFLNVSTCIGGTNVPRKLSPVPHVVISTLQGLCEMINCNSLCKDFIKMLVIDDAEEMFKCNGFFNKIRHILLFLNNNRQLVIMSTSKIEEILDQFSDLMQNPEYIIVPNEKPLLNDILQYCVYVPEEWKFDAFCELFEALNLIHTVVYCNTWNKSLGIVENMRLKTYIVSAVHNEMDTHQRHLILHQFQSGTSTVLVTTELQRGENFSDVAWVINYDLPKSPKDYVRKIISCFNRRVKVINFITSNDKTAKENIETAFNVNMLNLPQDLTGICVSNL